MIARRFDGTAAWLAAALGLTLLIGLFLPGFVTSDGAEQWQQARSGQYSSVHPPIMAMTWALTETILPGPGGIFVLHGLLFWAGLAWLAQGLFRKPLAQTAFVLAIGLWPSVFGTVIHVWKDVPMAACLLLAVAALVSQLHHPSRWRLLLALLLLALACAYRHNALPLVLPFLLHISIRLGVRTWPTRVLATIALAVLVYTLSGLPAQHPHVTQRQVWPMAAVWDLAAVSLAREEMRIPANWHAPDLTLDELRAAFRPWSNTSIFATNKILISLYRDPTPEQDQTLRTAWLALWWQTPGEFLAHRVRLSRHLFGLADEPLPTGMALSPSLFPLPGNPPLQLPESSSRDQLVRGLKSLLDTPFYSGWAYVLLLTALALLARVQRRVMHRLFWPMLGSAALLCAPLLVLAPSAEFRYLLWLVLVTGIAIGLWFVPNRNNPRLPEAASSADHAGFKSPNTRET